MIRTWLVIVMVIVVPWASIPALGLWLGSVSNSIPIPIDIDIVFDVSSRMVVQISSGILFNGCPILRG